MDELEDEELMRKLFPKKVMEEAKREAEDRPKGGSKRAKRPAENAENSGTSR
jgi:hypothetical protein